jgi:hypothetical protein
VLNKFTLRAAAFVALALVVMQSIMPLAGEILAQKGWISSTSMQVVCSTNGVKFISTADLKEQGSSHAVKCPWCQLGEPAVLPSAACITFSGQRHSVITPLQADPALSSAPWMLALARAPPQVLTHFP